MNDEQEVYAADTEPEKDRDLREARPVMAEDSVKEFEEWLMDIGLRF